MQRWLQKRVLVSGGSWLVLDIYGDVDTPGLVVVPGAMADAQSWRKVASFIETRQSVTVVNRRGRSPSGPLTAGYSMQTEVEDLEHVLEAIGGAETLFGWSYGGGVALLAANRLPLQQLIAYEPVIAGFGQHALGALESAHENADWERSVEIVNIMISGLTREHVDQLRSNRRNWQRLCELSMSVYPELRALNTISFPDELARLSEHVDLIVGEHNVGTEPYGTSYKEVLARVRRARTHQMKDQGHMAHITAPKELAALINALTTTRT